MIPLAICGINPDTAANSCGPSAVTNVTIADGSADITFHTAGSRFPAAKVMIAFASSLSAGPTSIPRAISPITFLAAAFIWLNDPDIVVAASFAVVPVMSNCPWIT